MPVKSIHGQITLAWHNLMATDWEVLRVSSYIYSFTIRFDYS